MDDDTYTLLMYTAHTHSISEHWYSQLWTLIYWICGYMPTLDGVHICTIIYHSKEHCLYLLALYGFCFPLFYVVIGMETAWERQTFGVGGRNLRHKRLYSRKSEKQRRDRSDVHSVFSCFKTFNVWSSCFAQKQGVTGAYATY